jgi:hypothetical protein
MPLSLTDIAWAAGFYEGEGSVAERSAVISQVNRWPLERLFLLFGGNIHKTRRDTRYEAQEIFQWVICGQNGRDFIRAIYPFLSPKRQNQINIKFLTDEKLALKQAAFKIKRSEESKTRNRNNKGQFINA